MGIEFLVIPGRRAAASPESITTVSEYGFRACHLWRSGMTKTKKGGHMPDPEWSLAATLGASPKISPAASSWIGSDGLGPYQSLRSN